MSSSISPDASTRVALLPLRSGVLFPGTVLSFSVGRARSVALLRSISAGDLIAVTPQRDASHGDPLREDLHDFGTMARVQKIARKSDNEFLLVVEGVGRVSIGALLQHSPYWEAEVTALDDQDFDPEQSKVLAAVLREQIGVLFGADGGALTQLNAPVEQPGLLADQVAAQLGMTTLQELEVLGELNVLERMRLVTKRLGEAKARAEVKAKIENEVRKEVGKNQRDAVLREQLRAIKKELGEDTQDELEGLRAKLEKAQLPEEAAKVAERELKRLEKMGPQAMEGHVIRNYLDWIADLPWAAHAEAKEDLDAIGQQLEKDHFGLADVKKRILEHMAVLKLAGNTRGTLLCLVGPPGVGKTSIAQSIASATGRPLARVALGGVRDEAEIRGHRRTYVGAIPGRILHAMKKTGVKNPVLLLDEIDKLGSGWAGNPEAALLEVLDPEQNKTFVDHYLELPFDLSEVLFICTANSLDTLSAPLRDRLEVIEISGYTPDEKTHIATNHLIPKRSKEHGIPDGVMSIPDASLLQIVRDYTREAGVRQLDREITKICRNVALDVAKNKDSKIAAKNIEATDVVKILGKPKFRGEIAERTSQPGVATGLAWTPFGGDILFIETSKMPGRGHVEITGQLGDVMKESARAALTYVRSHAQALGVKDDAFEKMDLHIHVPAGAVPKDGPSAGVTMFTAITSLVTGRKVRADTAMTGECTLRGRVLPVGGIKAKVLAAHRAGISRVILPGKNERDLDEVPEGIRDQLEVIFAEDMNEVLQAALEPVGEEGNVNEPVIAPSEFVEPTAPIADNGAH